MNSSYPSRLDGVGDTLHKHLHDVRPSDGTLNHSKDWRDSGKADSTGPGRMGTPYGTFYTALPRYPTGVPPGGLTLPVPREALLCREREGASLPS